MKRFKIIFILAFLLICASSMYSQDVYSVSIQETQRFVDTISYELSGNLSDGEYFIYRDAQKQTLFYKGTMQNGLKTGTWTWYNLTGSLLREIQYMAGIQHGTHTSYYPNGQKSMVMTFNQGVKEGVIMRWYNNGVKSLEGSYSNNNPSGNWTRWDDKGVVVSTENY